MKMRETFVRQLAAALWDEFEQSHEVPPSLSGKKFKDLGVPTQNVWLRLARRAAVEIHKFEMSQRDPNRSIRKKRDISTSGSSTG
jgi:hypothetical protein